MNDELSKYLPSYSNQDFQMEVVSTSIASISSCFSCGNSEIDKYFKENADQDNNVCYAYYDRKTGAVVGLASVCCSGINLNDKRITMLFPAIKIDFFAVSVDYQDILFPGSTCDEHFYLSDMFLCSLISELRNIADNCVGAAYIILYSVPKAEHFYRRNYFSKFEDFMRPEQHRYIDDCVPMLMRI